jgi:hypothetical protein
LVHAVTKRFFGLTDTPGQEVPMSHLNLNVNLNPMSEPPARAAAGATESRLEIDATRARQTERPVAPFRSVLAGGISLLMSGAEVATHVVGGPILAAAVHDARAGAAHALAGPGVGAPAAAAPAAAPTGNPEMPNVNALMGQGEMSSWQLLELQRQVQQENQRFTTVSNVMRAKHDTAKAAVSNIRA